MPAAARFRGTPSNRRRPHADSAGIDAAGRRCPYLPRTGLHDALLGQHPDARGERFHRHLHVGQVPASHRPGARDPRRWIGQDRSQSDRRRTSAHWPAAEAGPEENAPAETQGCRGTACRGIAFPQPGASGRARSGGRTTASAARPLIACTAPRPAPANGTQQRCRLCASSNMPTLWSRAPFADVTAAAPKGIFE